MSNKSLYSLWGVLFIICAVLGFIPVPSDAVQAVFTAASVLFFVPPLALLQRSGKQGDTNTAQLIRNLSVGSLSLTLVLLILSVICAVQSEFLGNFLHGILVIVSTPMICSGYWVLSLFLWACVLVYSLQILRKK
jgi:hypothetical protein